VNIVNLLCSHGFVNVIQAMNILFVTVNLVLSWWRIEGNVLV